MVVVRPMAATTFIGKILLLTTSRIEGLPDHGLFYWPVPRGLVIIGPFKSELFRSRCLFIDADCTREAQSETPSLITCLSPSTRHASRVQNLDVKLESPVDLC